MLSRFLGNLEINPRSEFVQSFQLTGLIGNHKVLYSKRVNKGPASGAVSYTSNLSHVVTHACHLLLVEPCDIQSAVAADVESG